MTSEQKQRIEQIQRAVLSLNSPLTQPIREDIDFLLSLVKSQEAGGKFARSVAETIAADLGYQGGTQNQRALAATIETALNNFATSMRSRCVEKVRDIAERLACTCIGERADHHARCPVTVGQEMITVLESVTIQEQKK